MAKIRQSNLDNSVVTGLGELTSVASGDQTIVYDASTGTLKKISQTNFLNFPTVSSVSPTSVTSGDGTGNHTFTITGSGFTGASASLINNSGTAISFDTVTVDSSTQITGVIAKSSLPGSGEPYDVKVTAGSGLASTLENQINIDQSPTYNTASGSVGTVADGARATASLDIEAFDPESAAGVTFEIQSGSLPAGASTATVNENGVSKFRISGTFSAVGSNTTSNFVLRAVDAASNTSSRAFSITVNAPQSTSFTSSGTFAVPAGVTTVDALLVGGGGSGSTGAGGSAGGGAGGLIFMPGYKVTPGGTLTVTIGCGPGTLGGEQIGQDGQNTVLGAPGDPGLGQGGVLTAQGGGGGGFTTSTGRAGGSGGGSGRDSGPRPGGPGQQSTQPGNSGAYGFGNPGGAVHWGGWTGASGGGGAGAAGSSPPNSPASAWSDIGGNGGAGRAYTIADGTTSVYYAGGGAAGGAGGVGTAGQGGGGSAIKSYAPGPPSSHGNDTATAGQANKGGGGGGGGQPGGGGGCPGGAGGGGKGIVVVRY